MYQKEFVEIDGKHYERLPKGLMIDDANHWFYPDATPMEDGTYVNDFGELVHYDAHFQQMWDDDEDEGCATC